MKIAMLGVGSMGLTLIEGMLTHGVDPVNIVGSVRRTERATQLQEQLGIAVKPPREAVLGADVVVVAVKPHDAVTLLREIADLLLPEQILVSVAAGLTTGLLESCVPGIPVVRVMPNTPASVGLGMAAVSPGSIVTTEQIAIVQQLFTATGDVVVIPESEQDAVSTVSGSGPAYLFLLAEAFIDAAKEMGLSAELSERLVIQTLLGSATLLQHSRIGPRELRRQVTSPGGTTAEAIAALENGDLRGSFIVALQAAHQRAKQLSYEAEEAARRA
ncbi:MAG: pyrroline-5-carboxylate reductase [Propionibacteriaceae bacterium]